MRDLMSTNVYEPRGRVLVVGACLPQMEPVGFEALRRGADMTYSLCLECAHVNMAITKLGAMLATGQVKKLTLATVDRSPHCVQMHYLKHEIARTLDLSGIDVGSCVVVDGRITPVTDEMVERSKSFVKLAAMA